MRIWEAFQGATHLIDYRRDDPLRFGRQTHGDGFNRAGLRRYAAFSSP
jgi:hypothetical protein